MGSGEAGQHSGRTGRTLLAPGTGTGQPTHTVPGAPETEADTKKKTCRASEANEEERAEFRDLASGLAAEELIFVDETGINVDLGRTYGRSPVGEPIMESRPVNTPQNLSVIGALGARGLLTSLCVEGAVDGECFAQFVEEMLVPELEPGQIVLMDNVAVHKSDRVQKALERAGAVLIFLPPYSPDLNPIEECWSKIKAGLRAVAARTRNKLLRGLKTVLAQITPHHIEGWFRHCGYNLAPE